MPETRIECPHCDARLAVDDAPAPGVKVDCPRCGTPFAMPGTRNGVAMSGRKRQKPKPDRMAGPLMLAAVVILVVGGVVSGVTYYKSRPFVSKAKAGPARQTGTAAVVGAGGLNVGETVKDITGEDIFGQTFKLSDYRGKVVVLDFWGHW